MSLRDETELLEGRGMESTGRVIAVDQGLRCHSCVERCLLRAGQVAPCGLRVDAEGRFPSRHLWRLRRAPVEETGLYHVYPTQGVLQLSPVEEPEHVTEGPGLLRTSHGSQTEIGAKRIADAARQSGCQGVLFSLPRPTYLLDGALDLLRSSTLAPFLKLLRAQACWTPESLVAISRVVDAVVIPLDSLREESCRQLGESSPHVVRNDLRELRERGVWFEVVSRLRPEVHDDPSELYELALSLREVGADVPWHLQAAPGLSDAVLHRALRIADEVGLRHVYAAQAPDRDHELTFCSDCGGLLLERFRGELLRMALNHCVQPVLK